MRPIPGYRPSMLWRCLGAALVLFPLLLVTAMAQGEYDEWHFGYHDRIRFISGSPVQIPGGRMEALQGSASICSPAGRLLFYTNGSKVWNRNGELMPEGTGLFGNRSSTQAALIVPDPGDSLRYYIFTNDGAEYPAEPNGYYYSIVDMRSESGLGDVVRKNVKVLSTSSEHQTAVRHCNGRDFWVITHAISGRDFIAFRLTPQGLVLPGVTSSLGAATSGYGPGEGWPTQGVLKASRDGRRLAASFGDGTSEVYDFDRATGVLSNPIRLTRNGHPFYHIGISFAPKGEKVYVSSRDVGLLQFSLGSGNPATIEASRFLVSPDPGADLLLGPDDRLYRISETGISIIRKPDLSDAACDLESNALPSGWLGLPNNIDALHPGMYCGTKAVIDADALEICQGDSLRLSGTSSVAESWEWSIPDGLPRTSTSRELAVAFRLPGARSVMLVTRGDGETDTARVTVLVHPAPSVAPMPEQHTCPGRCVTLAPVAGGGMPPFTYAWEPADGLSCRDCAMPRACPEATTTYRVRVTDARGCSTVDSVTVVVEPCPPKAIIAMAAAACLGTPIDIEGSASIGASWEWSFEGGVPAGSKRPAESVIFSEPGRHRVTLVVRNGALADTAFIDLDVAPLLVPDAGLDTMLCAPGCVDLAAGVTGGTAPYRYRWEPIDGLDFPDGPKPTACVTGTTTFRLTVTDARGCTAYDSVRVRVGCDAVARIVAASTLCEGDVGIFDGSASTGGGYDWIFEGGSPATSTDPKVGVAFATAGLHRARLIVREGAEADTAYADVRVTPRPTVSLGPDLSLCAGKCVELAPQIVSEALPLAYAWEPADGLSCADCRVPTACPSGTTTYRLAVTDANGCVGTDEITLTVAPCGAKARIAVADTPRCQGSPILFDGSASDADEWLWTFDGGLPASSGASSPTVVFNRPGTHAVRLIARRGDARDTALLAIDVAEAPAVDAGPDRTFCPGECLTLRATPAGGVPPYSYRWDSDAPLDCPDCVSPRICPDGSAIYRVTVTDARGCTATDEMVVTMLAPTTVRAHIPRGITAQPGATIELPVLLDDPVARLGLGRITISVAYDRSMLRLLAKDLAAGTATSGTLLDGWLVTDVADLPGSFSATFLAPSASTVVEGPGPLMRLRFSSHLTAARDGRIALVGELPLGIEVPLTCVTFAAEPGEARLEMCGLGLRLMEVIGAKYAITSVAPNPIRTSGTIDFSIALDGPTSVEVFDAAGAPAATLMKERLEAGSYSLTLEAGSLPSGTYYCRIRSGAWSEVVPLVIER